MNFDELIKLLQTNPEAFYNNKELTKEVVDTLKSLASGKSPSERLDATTAASTFDSALKSAMGTASGQQWFKQQVRDRNTDSFTRRNKPFFDALLAGADLATSISQIKESRSAERALIRPSLPNPNVLDPAINNAISDAQKGSTDALKALEPAKQEIAQQRLQDIAVARSVSGGQSGAYGGLATAASLRAMRSASQLPMIGEQIRARRLQRYDSLLGMRQGQLQNNFGNQMQVSNANFQQYNQDANAAAALGSAGRLNLRNTLGQFPGIISRVGGGLMPINQEWQDYGKRLQGNLVGRITGGASNVGANFNQPILPNYDGSSFYDLEGKQQDFN